MKKTILSETAIYTGTIDSPKGYEIDREKINELNEHFNELDVNKNGTLDKKELKKLLILSGEEITNELLDEIFELFDSDENGRITWREFIEGIQLNA